MTDVVWVDNNGVLIANVKRFLIVVFPTRGSWNPRWSCELWQATFNGWNDFIFDRYIVLSRECISEDEAKSIGLQNVGEMCK